MVGQTRGQDALVADRAMREDQHDVRVAHRQVRQPIGERRQSPAGMDQDRHPCAVGEREDGAHLRAVEHEVLSARVQLDAARSAAQAAFALGDRIFGGVQAAERGETTLAFRSPRDDAVVGDAVGGASLGVVQREHARAPRAGVVELGEQLCERQRAPVLVQTEVGVRVDHFGVRRTQTLRLRQKRGERLGVEGVVHGRHPSGSPAGARGCSPGHRPKIATCNHRRRRILSGDGDPRHGQERPAGSDACR